MKALNAGLSMEGATMYLFWLSTVAMGAGMFYFWLQRKTVPLQYQTAVTVSGIICAVAAFHYWRMSGIYLEGVASLFNEDVRVFQAQPSSNSQQPIATSIG